MDTEKEKYAALLAKRVERAVKAIKILVISAAVIAAGLIVFTVAVKDASSAVIGLTVFLSCIAVLLLSVLGVFIYAKINLKKLNKLD